MITVNSTSAPVANAGSLPKAVACSSDLPPWHLGLAVGQCLAEVLHCFADDLQLAYHRALGLAICHEAALPGACEIFESVC